MYYVMKCPLLVREEDDALLAAIQNNYKLVGIRRWWSGLAIAPEKKAKIPSLVEFQFERLRGYAGPPPELENLGITLMSKRLKEVLILSGVDNIELFPAVLKNEKASESYDYFIFNIIGKVPAAFFVDPDKIPLLSELNSNPAVRNLRKSEALLVENDEPLLCRVFESAGLIVVHEKIKNNIEDAGIDSLEFIEAGEYLKGVESAIEFVLEKDD